MSDLTWRMVARLVVRRESVRRQTPAEAETSELFAAFRTPLLRYVRSLGLPLADGEDVVQETFLSLFHHLRSGKPRDNLRGWIFRVGHNLALKRRWRDARQVEAPEAELAWADPAPDPEQTASFLHQRARLRAIVQALPERDRCCLMLRAEGLRYREIAEALGVSLGTVAASLSRSVGKLAAI